MALHTVNAGDEILAEDINQLVEAFSGLGGRAGIQRLSGAGGILASVFAGGGASLALLTLRRYLVPGRIVAVSSPAPQGQPAYPDQVSYAAVGIGKAQAQQVQGLFPRYGRPAQGHTAKIIPAAAGDLCMIVRVPNGEGGWVCQLWVLSETLAFAACV